MGVYTESKDHLILHVHVQPRAKRAGAAGIHGEALKVALREAPTDGKANAALVRYLAGELSLPRASIEIVSGETSRQKRIKLPLESKAALEEFLARWTG